MKQLKKSITILAMALSMSLASGIVAAADCEDIGKEIKKIYKKSCKKCHGKKGNGKGPGAKDMEPAPPSWTGGTDKSDEELVKIIMEGTTKDGKPTEMKGWAEGTAKKGKEVSEDQAASLVCIIRAFKK